MTKFFQTVISQQQPLDWQEPSHIWYIIYIIAVPFIKHSTPESGPGVEKRGQELGHIHFGILWQSVLNIHISAVNGKKPSILGTESYLSITSHFYSILFNPITLEGCRGTTDDFATISFRTTFRRGETRDSLKDCTSHCSFYKAEAMWRDNKISLGSKVKLMHSLAISYFCMSRVGRKILRN